MQLEIQVTPTAQSCEVAEDFTECITTIFNHVCLRDFSASYVYSNFLPLSLIWTFVKPFSVYDLQNISGLTFLALLYRLNRMFLELSLILFLILIYVTQPHYHLETNCCFFSVFVTRSIALATRRLIMLQTIYP
jgi:hypothetical protein